MYAVAKEYTETEDEYEQIKELDRRRGMRLSGQSKVITGVMQRKSFSKIEIILPSPQGEGLGMRQIHILLKNSNLPNAPANLLLINLLALLTIRYII